MKFFINTGGLLIESEVLKRKKHLLEEDGYTVLPSFFKREFLEDIHSTLISHLQSCAADLSCSYEDYMSSASRWVDPSPVTQGLTEKLFRPLQNCLELFVGECSLVKLNIISKTQHSLEPIPLHQDISYSPTSPYQVSGWLALTDSPLESGPLEIIVGSHKAPVQPAVDFWDPRFQASDFDSKGTSKALPVKAGDLILFDSRLWHGSARNTSNHERFAVVTRWIGKDYIPPLIPPINPKPFGMWMCQQQTQRILEESLEKLFDEKAHDYTELLLLWEKYMEKDQLFFITDKGKAKEALKCIRILHLAHTKHNGGDAQGTLYAQLWRVLLDPLMQHLPIEREEARDHLSLA